MTEDLKGTVFNGRYIILEKIGAGGMATVYRAKDEKSARFVAVKILSRELLARSPKEAERNLRRFKREAEILRLIGGSPHVVGFVEHACSESGDWFIAMELLEGEQLRYYIGRGRTVMGVSTFAHYGLHLVEGLAEIHARKILHRDLAPDNVVVVKDEQGLLVPKYLDFGIGKSLGNELDQVTQMLTIMGKPQYFSPEQARGMELTAASDVYSMGVMLYEMATGYVPLDIHGIPDFRKIQRDPPVPISQYREGQRLPETLQNVIMRCLAKQPEQRPTLDELRVELLELQNRIQSGEVFQTAGSTGPTVDHTAPVRLAEVELRPGDSVSRYEVKKLLGKGGMGAVYLAWDPVLHREVAIKVATRVEEEKAKKALLREARASSALRCENIVTIFDAGTEGGTPYIAMEYVNGSTLAEVIDREGPLSGERFWQLASGICAGLRFAHERPNPVIHRDLKPANMLVERHGIKITDFGIAKVAQGGRGGPAGAGGETQAQPVAGGEGTVATMSPEQANGKNVDHRSDIYSLGCVFYMMTTGRGPFQGNQIAILYQHCTTPPEPPSKHNPELRASGLDPIILKCLEKDPAKRWQSVAEIEAALRKLFVTETVEVKPWWRTRLGVAAAALMLLAIAAVTFAVTRKGGDAPPPPPPRFALQFVSGEPFVAERDQALVVRNSVLSLSAQAAPGARVVADATRKGSAEGGAKEEAAADDQGIVKIELRLPPEAGIELAEYDVRVSQPEVPESPSYAFEVAVDGVDPVVEYLAYEGLWRNLESNIATIGQPAPRLRVRDGGSGFALKDGSIVETIELRPGESPGPSLSLEWLASDPGMLVLTAQDRSKRGRSNDRFSVKPVTPEVAVESPLILSAQTPVPIACTLAAKGFDLVQTPLAGGVFAYLREAPDVTAPLRFENGRYRCELSLPARAAPATAHYDVGFRLDEPRIELPFAGEELRVRLDTQAPVLRVAISDGSSELVLRSDEPGADPPTVALPQGTTLSSRVRYGAEDPGATPFAKDARIAITCEGTSDTAPIPEGGALAPFPHLDLPATSEPILVQLSVRDACGNAASLSFRVKILGARVTRLSVAKRKPLDDVFHVPKSRGVEIEAGAVNLDPATSLVLEIRSADAETPRRIPLTQAGDTWTASIDLPAPTGLAGGVHNARLVITKDGVDLSPLDSFGIAVDTTAPAIAPVTPRFQQTPVPRHPATRFPLVELKFTDASALVHTKVQAQPSDPALPAPVIERSPADDDVAREVVYTLEPPAGDPRPGKYTITAEASDAAGNTTTFTAMVEVKPPEFRLLTLGGAEVVDDGKRGEQEIAVAASPLELEIQNRTDFGRFAIRAQVQASGATSVETLELARDFAGTSPRKLRIDLPAGAGKLLLEAVEISDEGESAGSAFPIGNVAWLIDKLEPDWTVFVKDQVLDRDKQHLANEGLRVKSLADVSIFVSDAGGLPADPVAARTAMPEMESVATEGQGVRFRLKAQPNWQAKDVHFQVRDRAGNRSEIRFKIYEATDRPALRSVTVGSSRVDLQACKLEYSIVSPK